MMIKTLLRRDSFRSYDDSPEKKRIFLCFSLDLSLPYHGQAQLFGAPRDTKGPSRGRSLNPIMIPTRAMAHNFIKRRTRVRVLYIDKKAIVISKPPGIISQLRLNTDENMGGPETLDGLLNDLAQKLQLDSRPLTVHRLDKPTTGALLLARTPEAARDFSQQFSARSIKKTYLAIVRAGRETFDGGSGEINAPLTFSEGRTRLSKKGVDARTSWKLVTSSEIAPVSLLRLTLHTGVKHQLRVHLANILKAPILGDTLHSRSKLSEKIRNVVSVPENRLFLHSSHISFSRYRKLAPRRYTVGVVAPLPMDFITLCAQLGLALDDRDVHGGVTVNDESAPSNLTDYESWWENRGISLHGEEYGIIHKVQL